MNNNIIIMDHPLLAHKITILRKKTTGTNEFRKLVEEIAMLMGYEAMRDLPTANIEISISGTTVTTTVTGSIAPVNNLNAKSLLITRKRMSDSSTTTYSVNPLSAYNYSVTWTQTIADIGTESYEYTAAVTDTKQTVTAKRQTAVICISRLAGGRGVTLFQEASQEGFWVRDIQHDISTSEYVELANMLASDYSTGSPYFIGQFTKYNSKVWECKTAISSGEAWNASHWTELGAST